MYARDIYSPFKCGDSFELTNCGTGFNNSYFEGTFTKVNLAKNNSLQYNFQILATKAAHRPAMKGVQGVQYTMAPDCEDSPPTTKK